MSSRSAVVAQPEAELDKFARFCGLLTLEDGSQFELEPFQQTLLGDYFEGVRETLILINKKNGKSTLIATIALYHLLTTPDAECVIAAASRDQAQIMLRQAQGFIRRSPFLRQRFQVKQREIIHERLNGRIRVLASDEHTADGVIPTLALVDELHRHKTADLYGIFRDGLGPRNGQMITISTAGDDAGSPLGELRARAHAQPGMVRDGAYRYVKTPGFVMHEWALDPDQDRDDLELVKQANPASWQTIEVLRQRRESPSMKDWQWARFACGVWIAGEDAAISEREWRECARPDLRIPVDAKGVYVGIDLGWKWDTTAIVPLWRDEEGVVRAHCPTIIVPPQDGTSTSFEDVWEPVQEFAETWPQVTFVLDPNAGGEQLAQRIDVELDARVATHSQMPSAMALASQRLSDAISSKTLAHPDDPAYNAQVLAAAARAVGEGFRFVKQKKKKLPIDAVIATAIALSAMLGTEDEPVYERATFTW